MQEKAEKTNFIREIIKEDLAEQRISRLITRFPPEPNGFLHIGHAKAIFIDFGLAEEFGGEYHLRFDDTNPSKEEQRYIDSIIEDIKWLGFDWGEHLYYASDYFDKMHEYAVKLIKDGKAFVCDLNAEEIREYRGTLQEPGKESPCRNRSIDENLSLFEKMTNGDFEDGKKVLRAKIDMASPNLNMRDPVMYRIQKRRHHRQGDKWNVYPMYDWAHGLEDSLEGITHSLCTLEFEDHRPLYDWFLEQLDIHHPRQIEFARLNLTFTVMSKRKLLMLVNDNYVEGWDDPRMPTLSGLRRRGYTPSSIKDFCSRIGVAKANSTVDIALLEHCLREELNKTAPRKMAVLEPLKVTIENYPENSTEELEAVNNPEDPEAGTRKVPFGREIYIERDDFMEDPPKKFFRLAPGREVRLRYAYFITCKEVIKDDSGNITELICTYDPETRGGDAPDGRKVKGTLHWVSAAGSKKATVRLYENLFTKGDPSDIPEGKDFTDFINTDSVKTIDNARIEPSFAELSPEDRVQFERKGYFCADRLLYSKDNPVFNRIVSLKDTWGKISRKK
ncbi:MAG: glutamine--tRNA ligase/YqeY domain fusion protein [Fibrobacterota bacterium]